MAKLSQSKSEFLAKAAEFYDKLSLKHHLYNKNSTPT
jgi:hypothetical protein